MSEKEVLLYIEGVVDAQATPLTLPKPRPPQGDLVDVKKLRESVRSFLVKVRDSLRRKPFLDYFLSEASLSPSLFRVYMSVL